MNCVSYDICVYRTFGLFGVFPWGILPLQSDWSLSCDHGHDYTSYCENNNSNSNNNNTHNNNNNNNNNNRGIIIGSVIWGVMELPMRGAACKRGARVSCLSKRGTMELAGGSGLPEASSSAVESASEKKY